MPCENHSYKKDKPSRWWVFIFSCWITILMCIFSFVIFVLSLLCNIVMVCLFSHSKFGWKLLERNECFNSPLLLWQHLNSFFTFMDLYQTSVELNLKLFLHFKYLIISVKYHIINSAVSYLKSHGNVYFEANFTDEKLRHREWNE